MIFFDIDGVLNKLDRPAYENTPDNPTPIYMRKGQHYFRYATPDMRAVGALYTLMSRPEHHHPVVISTVMSGDMFDEHVSDKTAWLDNLAQQVGTYRPQALYVDHKESTKPNTARAYLEEITENLPQDKLLAPCHILLDDYNKNLEEWRNAGGTAIKYINGENDAKSWSGISTPAHCTAFQLASFLVEIEQNPTLTPGVKTC